MGLLVALAASATPLARLVTDVVLESRKQGGMGAASSLNPTEVSGTLGAVTGAVVGAIAACGVLRRPPAPIPPAPEESLA